MGQSGCFLYMGDYWNWRIFRKEFSYLMLPKVVLSRAKPIHREAVMLQIQSNMFHSLILSTIKPHTLVKLQTQGSQKNGQLILFSKLVK